MSHPADGDLQYFKEQLDTVISCRCTAIEYEKEGHDLWIGLCFENGQRVWFYSDAEGNMPGWPMVDRWKEAHD